MAIVTRPTFLPGLPNGTFAAGLALGLSAAAPAKEAAVPEKQVSAPGPGQPAGVVQKPGGRIVATPLARRLAREAGVDMVLSTPITVADLEELLGLSIEERRLRFPATAGRSWAALPVSVGAAMIAIAVLMIG